MTLRGLSSGTQENDLRPVIKLHEYYKRNPARLNEDEIKAFLLSPKNQSLAASTYNIIIHSLRFLSKPNLAILIPKKREPQKLPEILSATEVAKIIK